MDSEIFRYQRKRVFGERGDPLTVRREGTQGDFVAHDHEFIEIVLTTAGSGVQRTARRELPMQRGTLSILRPGHWHEYADCRGLAIYNYCFGPELLRRELAWLMDEPKLARLLWGAGEATGGQAEPYVFQLEPAATQRLRRLLDDFPADGAAASYSVKVAHLSLYLTSLAQALPLAEIDLLEKPPLAVTRSLRRMEQDLAQAWSVRQLAREAGCTPEYLIRLFRRAIGLTPYAYLNRCRAETAAALLLRTDASIAEIATRVGWGDPCHFARQFRRHYGSSASSYRRQMRDSVGSAPVPE